MSYPLSLSFYGFRPPSRPVGGLVLISSCYLSLELLPVRTWLFAHAIVRVPLAVTQQDRKPACWPISWHSSFCNIAIKSWTVGYDKSLSLQRTHTQANVSHFLAHTQAGSCLSSVTLDAVASLTQSIKKKKISLLHCGSQMLSKYLLARAAPDTQRHVWCVMFNGSRTSLWPAATMDGDGGQRGKARCTHHMPPLCQSKKRSRFGARVYRVQRDAKKKKKSEGLWVHLSAQQHHTTLVCLTMAKHRIAHNRSLGGM